MNEVDFSIDVPDEPLNEKKKGRPKQAETVFKYKLNLRQPSGLIRADIPKSILLTIMTRWPDLIRTIPSDRWVTDDEIEERVNRGNPLKRTREDIKIGVDFFLESGVLLRDG